MLDHAPQPMAPFDPATTDASALLVRNGLVPIEPQAGSDVGRLADVGLGRAGGVASDDDPAGRVVPRDQSPSLHHRVDQLEQRLRQTERELRRMRHRLVLAELAANTDPLTGISNRRHFEEVLAAAVAVVRHLGRPLSLLMIDVDQFKRFNDDFSHPIGDHVLRFVAGVLTHRWRGDTFAARYGGEEFAMLSLRTPLDEAFERAEWIRMRLGRHQKYMRGTQARLRAVTVSIGVAELGPSEAPGEILQRADRALYQAKRGGRDRVVADTSPP
jgi:diguanylate cyclase